jgi:hypothetical protein
MLSSWANTIVLVALGLGLGAVGALAQLLAPPAMERVMHSRKKGEGLFRGADRRAREQSEIIRTGPRGFRIAAYAQVALLVVLIVTVWLSPVDLGWWTLLISIGVGALLMALAFRLARSGRLVVRSGSRFDPLAGVDFSSPARASEGIREQPPPPAVP